MGIRMRKFIGVIVTVTFLTAYSLAAMVVGAVWFIEQPAWLQLGYYVVAGLAWLPAVMAIIAWMARPARQS